MELLRIDRSNETIVLLSTFVPIYQSSDHAEILDVIPTGSVWPHRERLTQPGASDPTGTGWHWLRGKIGMRPSASINIHRLSRRTKHYQRTTKESRSQTIFSSHTLTRIMAQSRSARVYIRITSLRSSKPNPSYLAKIIKTSPDSSLANLKNIIKYLASEDRFVGQIHQSTKPCGTS